MLNVNLVGDTYPLLGVPADFNPPQASLPPSGEGFIQAHRRYPESHRLRLLGFRHR